jgi:hypothetical protein
MWIDLLDDAHCEAKAPRLGLPGFQIAWVIV